MKYKTYKGQGKDYFFTLKILKRLCIRFYGIGFFFATPRVRCLLLETMNEFIDDLCEALRDE